MNTKPENLSLLMKRANRLKQNSTKEELRVKDLLDRTEIKFMFQKVFCASRTGFIVDFYFPRPRRLCLEIDGSHHAVEPQLSRDRVRDEYLERERGVKKVLRLTNAEAARITTDELKILLG